MQLVFLFLRPGPFVFVAHEMQKGRGLVWGDSHSEDAFARGRAALTRHNDARPCPGIAKSESPFASHLPAPVMNPSHPRLKTQSPPWR